MPMAERQVIHTNTPIFEPLKYTQYILNFRFSRLRAMKNVIVAPYLYLGLVIRQVLFFYFKAVAMHTSGVTIIATIKVR